jgi:CRP/FNR family cyclic AMP-dependent transcriptional regulator
MKMASFFKHSDDIRTVPPGEVLFREGDMGDTMIVLIEGSVELSVAGTVVARVEEGDVFGEMALLDPESKTRSATATTATECRLQDVNERRFLFMVSETPFFALHLMRLMATRLKLMNATKRADS